MDPISAWAVAVGKIADMITEIARGQTPAQREKIWQWFVEDQERWRRLLGIDEQVKKP